MAPRKAAETEAKRLSANMRKMALDAKSTQPESKVSAANTSAPRAKVNGTATKSKTVADKSSQSKVTKNATTPKTSPKAKATTKKTVAEPKASGKATKPATKKAAPSTAAKRESTPTTTKKASKTAGTKRPAPEEQPATGNKRVKKSPAPQRAATPKPKPAPKKKPAINAVPTQKLHVFVCGDGSSGELGLGAVKAAIDVKRPRLNANLSADTVGVVQVAVGGMHALALTHDNKILSWGVNDQGALGRDTSWEGGLRDMDEMSDDSSNEGENLNPKEATPTAIPSDFFPDDAIFVKLAAGDSSSWALTEDGHVYGWGTFRSNEGVIGFRKDIHIQHNPMLVPELKDITDIVCGANHVLARNTKNKIFAWGNGQQNQLGRRVVERSKIEGLMPRELGVARKKITAIGCGSYHSFAIDTDHNVYAWGLNSFGECGIEVDTEESTGIVTVPTKVPSLVGQNVFQISGGSHHSAGVTKTGELLTWGRLDGFALGMPIQSLPESDLVKDERGRPRILAVPHAVSALGNKAVYAACGSDHTIAISKEGKAYTCGFSANYQTGQGTDEDIEEATMIDNTATRDKHLNWADAGGQFTVLTAFAGDVPKVNGV